MKNKDPYGHYNKRLRLCTRILNGLPNCFHNKKWDKFVIYHRYYNDKLKSIDKFVSDMILSDVSRNVGNYGNYFSDPVEMEKYKEKVRLRNKYSDILPDANTYHSNYFKVSTWDGFNAKPIINVKDFKNPRPDAIRAFPECITFKRINVNSPNGIFKQWEADI